LEIPRAPRYPKAMPNQTGPRTAEGKAVTRYNAATHGIYSVTPVLPRVESQADWLAHRAHVFADLQPDGYAQEIIAERIARPVMSSSSRAAGIPARYGICTTPSCMKMPRVFT